MENVRRMVGFFLGGSRETTEIEAVLKVESKEQGGGGPT